MKELSDKLKQYCETAEVMRLSYVDKSGHPHVVPVWFAKLHGDFYLGTYKSAQKAKSFQSNPNAGWVIDGGERPHLWGASFTGHAEVVTDSKVRAEIYEALGKKYYGSTDNEEFVKIYGQADDANTTYFKLITESQNGWEY